MKPAPTYATRETMGNPPELEWIPVAQMFVDKEYQRSTETGAGKALIEKIAQEFNWSKFQVVVVTRRPDGMYAVIDGQHRRQGAIKCGLSSLPCIVVDTTTVAAEADIFVSVNSGRVGVQPYQMFWSKLTAGRPDAVAVKAVCDAAGVVIPRNSTKSSNTGHKRLDLAPNETVAITAISSAIRSYGPEITTETLKLLVDAFPARRGQMRQGVIKGLSLFVSKQQGRYNRTRLISQLGLQDTEVLEASAKASKANFNGRIDLALAAQIAMLYGEVLLTPPAPQIATRLAVPAAPVKAPAKPFTSIMRSTSPALVARPVPPPVSSGILTCSCKRQFRPDKPKQTRCNYCLTPAEWGG